MGGGSDMQTIKGGGGGGLRKGKVPPPARSAVFGSSLFGGTDYLSILTPENSYDAIRYETMQR